MFICETNLDISEKERFPTSSDASDVAPVKGDLVISAYTWPNGFQLNLLVENVVWKKGANKWVRIVTLGSNVLSDFNDYYKSATQRD